MSPGQDRMDPLAPRVAARFLAASKTSPMIFKYLDGVFAKNRARYEEQARESVDEDELRKMLKRKPTASDDELLPVALKKLSLGIDSALDFEFTKFVAPYMKDVFQQTSEWWHEDATLEGSDLVLSARMEGTWIERPDDPYEQVEVPADRDMHDKQIEAALKRAGAYMANADWHMGRPEDPTTGAGYDAVKYDVRAKWKVDIKEVYLHYGKAAFEAEYRKVMARIRSGESV